MSSKILILPGSLSARRAWIEILASRLADMSAAVALRKESVDRNLSMGLDGRFKLWSLSARRAWIEMTRTAFWFFVALVALRKESVDRNFALFPASKSA